MLVQNKEMVWIGIGCFIVAILLIFAGTLFTSVILMSLAMAIGLVLIIWPIVVFHDLYHCYKGMTEREQPYFWLCWYDTSTGGIWMREGKRIGG